MGKNTHQSGESDPTSKDPVSLTLNPFDCLGSPANTFGKKLKRYQIFLKFSELS